MKDKTPHIRQEGDTFTVDFVKTIEGRRIHIYKKGFLSLKAAESAIPLIVQRRLKRANEDILLTETFEHFVKRYLNYRGRKVSGSTLVSIQSIIDAHFQEFHGLDIATAFDIDFILRWYDGMVGQAELCEKYKNRIFGEMRAIVNFAAKTKSISVELANDINGLIENVAISKKKKERPYYTKNQLKKFLSAIDDPDDKDRFGLFVYLGARISEFTGLTWGCFDPKNKTIEIKQQVIYLKENRPILTSSLKTRESYRKCKLTTVMYEMLLRRRQEDDDAFIFPKSEKAPHSPTPKTALRKKMVQYMDKAKLPRISAHGFRHSKATLLMSVCKGMADVKAAARFLGHSTTMMMETYAHEDRRNTDEIIRRLEIEGI